MNKLKIGIFKNKKQNAGYKGKLKDKDIICTVGFEDNITIDELDGKITKGIGPKWKEKIGTVTDDDMIYIITDLGEKMEGCAVSGGTYNATRVSITTMMFRQLARQVISELKHKK